MREDPAIFVRGALFVILSIRQRIYLVPAQLSDVVDRGDESDYLFGHKRNAYAFIMAEGKRLHSDILAAATNGERIDILSRVPGLGIVKAAFVLQLMGYDVACLDSRNVKREGRNPRAYRSDGTRKETCRRAWERKIARYLGETEGKARDYWNAWCQDVAEAYDMTAQEVSALHLAIVPDNYVPF